MNVKNKEFLKRLDELEEEIRNDPKMKALLEKMDREMGTLSHEDLHKVYRGFMVLNTQKG